MNYRYAELVNNRVIQVVETLHPIDSSASIVNSWVEISNTKPSPQKDWTFDPVRGAFIAPSTDYNLFHAIQEEAKHEIDRAAGQVRLKFMTDIPGQVEVYREKYDEAIDFLSSAQQVNYAHYPLMKIDAEMLNLPIKNIAEIIVKKRIDWISKISTIESVRLNGKRKIDNCNASISDIKSILSHVVQQLQHLYTHL